MKVVYIEFYINIIMTDCLYVICHVTPMNYQSHINLNAQALHQLSGYLVIIVDQM